jgi:hypothetical protein
MVASGRIEKMIIDHLPIVDLTVRLKLADPS